MKTITLDMWISEHNYGFGSKPHLMVSNAYGHMKVGVSADVSDTLRGLSGKQVMGMKVKFVLEIPEETPAEIRTDILRLVEDALKKRGL